MVCSYRQHLRLCTRCVDELATPWQADEDGEDAIDDADGLDDANEVLIELVCDDNKRDLLLRPDRPFLLESVGCR